jgi:hypothetical protein
MSSALRYRLLRVLLICLILAGASQALDAATIRGRLQRVLPNGAWVPIGGVTVTVFSQAIGRSLPAISQLQDGMYYLNNVPPGNYNLEVWIRGTNNPPLVYTIAVNEPYTDLAPVNLP